MLDKFTHVYFAHIPFVCDGYVCDLRKQEIESCSNLKVKQEKFYIWKLLEIAFKESLGIDIRDVDFKKLDSGKWICDRCHFSLSHSHGVVCVAISDAFIGVDIEYVDLKRHPLSLLDKTICESEICRTENDFFELWTIKEAFFKYSNATYFDPKKIDTTKLTNFKTDYLNIGIERYVYTIVGDNLENIKTYFK